MKTTIIHNHPIHYKHLLFSELKRQGLDIDVVFLAGESKIRHEHIPLSDEAYRSHIAWPGPYETAPLWRRIKFPWKMLRETYPDAVIISGYYAAECWSAWVWAILAGKPVIMWFESNQFDYPRHWAKELLKRIFCSRVARAHVYGHSNRDYLIRLGIPSDSIDVKRAVADVDKFAQPERPVRCNVDQPRRLLYVGRLAPEKNLSFLLSAVALSMQKYSAADLHLTLAGSGPCLESLQAEAASLGIAERVDFRGYTPQKDLPELYRSMDLFVLPSTREPWGLVSLEAMLARLPVLISTQCGCAADVVTPETGWTFSPHRVDELAALLARLSVCDPEELRKMGNAAFELAKQYSPANCAEIVIRSVNQVLNGQERVPPMASARSVDL